MSLPFSPGRCSIRSPGAPRLELKLREEGSVSLERQTASTSEPVGYWALLRNNARYRRLWAGLVVSMAGDWFRTIALYHLVMHLTGASGLALSGVVLAQTLSLFLLSPVAGVVADRVSRKAIMIGADLVRAGLALGFLLVTSAERVWLAYALTAALMGVAAFFNPAHAATIPNITTRRELMAANALTSASWAAMLAVGAALGGVVAAVLGTGAAFVINAAAYVVSAWCISGVPIPATPTLEKSSTGRPHNGWQDFWHGLRYMGARPPVLRLLSVKAWSAGVGGGLLILFALFAERLFQAGAMGMGTLYMTRGLGAMRFHQGRPAGGSADRRPSVRRHHRPARLGGVRARAALGSAPPAARLGGPWPWSGSCSSWRRSGATSTRLCARCSRAKRVWK